MMEVMQSGSPEMHVNHETAEDTRQMEADEEPYEETSRALVNGLNPVDAVLLTADRGYFLWTNPQGSIEVKFKYGRSGENFNCFIDPQHQGVSIYELSGIRRKELIVDGAEPLAMNTNPHHVKSTGVRKRENNFEFRSRDSEVRLELEAVRDFYKASPLRAFKLNYVLTL